IAVGRLGCFLSGCCTGSLCPTWMHRLCVRYPPGTEAYNHQLAAHMLEAGSAFSLPVYPLPMYFGLASLLTLVLLIKLLRRNARSGTLLLTFCIIRPLTRLVLDPLRAVSPVGRLNLMPAIPLRVLAV